MTSTTLLPPGHNQGSRSLIKGLLEQGTMSVVYGESNSGKTFFALDIAAHISLGWKWQKRNTRKGRVVYIAAESGQGVALRLAAFRRHYELENYGDMYLGLHTILLSGEENDCDGLITTLDGIGDVSLVVVDTLARAMGGGNENSSDDMGFFIRCCDRIREETGAHVMVIHHSGKDSSKGARGHSSLRAAIDTEIRVSQENEVIVAQVVKQRDGRNGDSFHFKLGVVQLGEDEDNEPLSSCVLLPSVPGVKAPRLVGQKRRALDILRNCLIDLGQKRRVRQDMVMVNCVLIEEFREYLRRERISSSDKPDSVNKAITRAIDSLNNDGVTASYGDYIWIADSPDKSRQTIAA